MLSDKTPLGGILKDTKHGWLALGPKFCVVDLRTGMKVAARTFGATLRYLFKFLHNLKHHTTRNPAFRTCKDPRKILRLWTELCWLQTSYITSWQTKHAHNGPI